jgi:hypothetical protein
MNTEPHSSIAAKSSSLIKDHGAEAIAAEAEFGCHVANQQVDADAARQ